MTPSSKSVTLNSNGKAYLGRTAPITPSANPAWLAGKPLNTWVSIAGTSGADGQALNAWCDFGIKQSNGELVIALAGGHDDGYGTAVSSILLTADVPAWKSPRRRDPLPLAQVNYSQSVNGAPPPNAVFDSTAVFPYCKDGTTPSSRHTRYATHHCTQNDRIMIMSSHSLFGYGGSESTPSNGFNMATNTWDPPGTYANAPTPSAYGTAIDDLGNIWCRSHKYTLATNTFAALPTTYSNSSAFDTKRRKLFTLCNGDGQGFSLSVGVVAKTINENLSAWQVITFNPSAAYTEFSGQTLDYSGMTYDPVRDRFLFYYGKGISQGVIYVITPNSGTVWDMTKITPGAVVPPLPPDAGTNGRFKYVAALDGVVLMPNNASNIYFMKLG